MKLESKCGLCGINPKWLQFFATTRAFIIVYGLLGTIQGMSFIYIGVSLTTLEKRFKIPSRTTGILLTGMEISQVMSVILIYYGNAGHRPRWIAIGVFISALSCLVLAFPHFLYGPGQEALSLTHEYLNSSVLPIGGIDKKKLPMCSKYSRPEDCIEDNSSDTSIIPKLLIFFSQILLGIGTTLYYGLGQTYMDDNIKKKKIPLILGILFSLRMFGPVVGFVLSYYCLRMYIDPTLHPIIDDQDPRWLGAWWLGWIILGVMMAMSALLLAMFPSQLRKHKSKKRKALSECEVPLKTEQLESHLPEMEKPTLRDFVISTKRIMKNKLFMFNTFSGVFYILASAPYIYFVAKYLEVQYGTSSGGGTIIAGPLKLGGVVIGFMLSGIVITKYKPSPRPLLSWNVIIGLAYVLIRFGFMYIKCDTARIQGVDLETMTLNLTASCNADCNCEQAKFSPVCHEPSGMTFFSACHAGCQRVINDTAFGDCNCVSSLDYRINDSLSLNSAPLRIEDDIFKTFQEYKNVVTVGPCKQDCFKPYMIFSFLQAFGWILGCSGKIGNVLLSYRCVEPKDKGLAQGVSLMLLSLIALIPAPIIAGWLMDTTCLIWDISCESTGNCWVYHKDQFNWVINASGAGLAFIGVLFDVFICYYSRDLDLYGEEEEKAERLRISQLKNDATNTETSSAKS